mmetsp:Transcript_22154/g.87891  ORF Transcript_22154/g.87891 Transcript_22154/m.87891 type:complete len:208 (+) Transcript_22154:1321-1944(+)
MPPAKRLRAQQGRAKLGDDDAPGHDDDDPGTGATQPHHGTARGDRDLLRDRASAGCSKQPSLRWHSSPSEEGDSSHLAPDQPRPTTGVPEELGRPPLSTLGEVHRPHGSRRACRAARRTRPTSRRRARRRRGCPRCGGGRARAWPPSSPTRRSRRLGRPARRRRRRRPRGSRPPTRASRRATDRRPRRTPSTRPTTCVLRIAAREAR